MSTNELKTKKCPFCAEEVKAEAVICRFCKADLEKNQPPQTTSVPEVAPKQKTSVGDGMRNGCGMFIVIGIVLFIFIIIGVLGGR